MSTRRISASSAARPSASEMGWTEYACVNAPSWSCVGTLSSTMYCDATSVKSVALARATSVAGAEPSTPTMRLFGIFSATSGSG